MRKASILVSVFFLCLTATLHLSGCGSADEESYLEEVRKINEALSVQLKELGEEAAEIHLGSEGERQDHLVEVLGHMALVLEEGVQEMSRVKVPAGKEETHLSLIRLLSSMSRSCRETASALNPHAVEGKEKGFVHEEEGGMEEHDAPGGEQREETSSGEITSENTGQKGGH